MHCPEPEGEDRQLHQCLLVPLSSSWMEGKGFMEAWGVALVANLPA